MVAMGDHVAWDALQVENARLIALLDFPNHIALPRGCLDAAAPPQ